MGTRLASYRRLLPGTQRRHPSLLVRANASNISGPRVWTRLLLVVFKELSAVTDLAKARGSIRFLGGRAYDRCCRTSTSKPHDRSCYRANIPLIGAARLLAGHTAAVRLQQKATDLLLLQITRGSHVTIILKASRLFESQFNKIKTLSMKISSKAKKKTKKTK